MSAPRVSQIASVFEPAARLQGLGAYTPGKRAPWIDLFLDANEGAMCAQTQSDLISSIDPELIRRYPDASGLEAKIAESIGVTPSRVIITNGGDDAIDRVCKVALEPGRELVLHEPTFEMIARSAVLAGGRVLRVPWFDGPFPVAGILERIVPGVGLVSIVSPNNPTGATAPVEAMLDVASAARRVGALVLVDLAYVEFADADPTEALLGLDNIAMVRTFSKAAGLAGLRVGYAIAPEPIAEPLRIAGGPYPVSALSLVIAERSLNQTEARNRSIKRIRMERERLSALLVSLGCAAERSEANFLLVRTPRADFIWRALSSMGIAVRRFAGSAVLGESLRISLPGDADAFDRLERALMTILRPEAVLLDLDGVLADVGASYREAIILTTASFGVNTDAAEIQRIKDDGDANNDWILTQRLLLANGVEASLDEVTTLFQEFYLGAADTPGLSERESLIPSVQTLRSLRDRARLAIVTGRPREEAEWFLERFGIADLFETLVCMEDAPAKPSPKPVKLAMQRLGVSRAWMVGDTPDDMVAARLAGALPLGVAAPGQGFADATRVLNECGAAEVLASLDRIEEILP